MPEVIIPDASCLIVLHNIGQLAILKGVYGTVTTTTDVQLEFGQSMPDWVSIRNPSDRSKQDILELTLGKGESSAIALAIEISSCLIILDDHKARNVAKKLGIRHTGTLGVMLKAKQMGVITEIKPLLDALRADHFWLSPEVEAEVLRLAGE